MRKEEQKSLPIFHPPPLYNFRDLYHVPLHWSFFLPELKNLQLHSSLGRCPDPWLSFSASFPALQYPFSDWANRTVYNLLNSHTRDLFVDTTILPYFQSLSNRLCRAISLDIVNIFMGARELEWGWSEMTLNLSFGRLWGIKKVINTGKFSVKRLKLHLTDSEHEKMKSKWVAKMFYIHTHHGQEESLF